MQCAPAVCVRVLAELSDVTTTVASISWELSVVHRVHLMSREIRGE